MNVIGEFLKWRCDIDLNQLSGLRLVVSGKGKWIFIHLAKTSFSISLWVDLGPKVNGFIHLLFVDLLIFVIIQIGFMLVVKVECISILKVLVLFSGLSLASITFLPEWEIDVVAIETHPVSFTCLVLGFGDLWGGLAIFYGGGVIILHEGWGRF